MTPATNKSKDVQEKDEKADKDTFLENVMGHLKRAFDWMDKVTDDDTKAVVMERAFEFLENALIDKYDVRLVTEDDHPSSRSVNEDGSIKYDDDGPMGYDLNGLIRGVGWSKRQTMFEGDARRLQEIQGVEYQDTTASTVTAREAARFIIGRAVIQDDRIREDLVNILTAGLNMYVRDPAKWQKGASQ